MIGYALIKKKTGEILMSEGVLQVYRSLSTLKSKNLASKKHLKRNGEAIVKIEYEITELL